MSRIRYDQLSKQHLEEFLEILGQVIRSREIPGEPLFVDLWFQPDPSAAGRAAELGLLGEMAKTASVIEPYHQSPNADELRSCVYKQIHVIQQMKREQRGIREAALSRLWIVTPTLSEERLKSIGAVRSETYPAGVYALPSLFRSYVIVIHQLPETEATVWLRMIGSGKVQRRAIAEIVAMPEEDERRERALRVLSNWKVISEQVGVEDEEDEAFVMALSQAFLELEQKIEQRGIEQGREEGRQEEACGLLSRVLRVRFGELPEALVGTIETMSTEQIESMVDEVFTFARLEDVSAWLSEHVEEGDRP